MTLEREFSELARRLASRVDHIQGAGGNISIKGDDVMLIKASGVEFRNINETYGFVEVDHLQIADYFKNNLDIPRDIGESDSIALMNACITRTSEKRPSMETGFHACLGRVVVHTHSVYANLLNCRREATSDFRKIKEILPYSSALLEYKSPGFSLSQMIASESNKSDIIPRVLFLKNHGIVVHGDTIEEVILILENSDRILMEFYSVEEMKLDVFFGLSDDVEDYFIFPDQVVYFQSKVESLTQSHIEIMAAYNYIMEGIRNSGGECESLASDEIEYLKNMEMEKHRMKENRIV